MGRLVFLGTAAALPLRDRANTALAITDHEPAGTLLVDCGGDPYRALIRAGFAADAVRDLLITHAHIDHIGGLPSLLESLRLGGRMRPLRVWALPVVLDVVHKLIAAYDFELKLDAWAYDVELLPIQSGQTVRLAGMDVTPVAMDHSIPSVGIRIALPGGPLAYTCDTQPNPNIAGLAHGARTLITECTFLHGAVAAARASKHMTALEAGQAAAECGGQRLALVHLGSDAVIAGAASEAGSAYTGEIIIPADGDVLEV